MTSVIVKKAKEEQAIGDSFLLGLITGVAICLFILWVAA